jgi:trimeric autotransporter adhesin
LRTFGFFVIFAGLAAAETQSGVVRSGGQPIPGASVTAICGSDKIATVTDEAGQFDLGGLPSTPCRFAVAIFGFEAAPRDAAASSTPLTFDLRLQARATVPADTQSRPQPGFRQRPDGGPGRGGFGGAGRGGFGRGGQANAAGAQGANQPAANPGFQNLSLLQNGDSAPVDADAVPGAIGALGTSDGAGANEAFLVNGSLSQGVAPQPGDFIGLGGPGAFFGQGGGPAGNPFGAANNTPGATPGAAAFNEADAQAAPVIAGGGGFGGGGGRGGGGGGGGRGGFGGGGGGRGGGRGRGGQPNRNFQFGNRINRGRGRQFQGSAYYTIGNSVLNARPYSFTTGQPDVPKSGYAANRFGLSAGGPLSIPRLFSSDKTFWFVNYTGNRSKSPVDRVTTVPLATQRLGDFSGLATPIFQPFTRTPFPGNQIPASQIDPAAAALLNLIPLPNAPGLRNNYQLIASNPTNSDNLQVRINQTLTTKDRLDVNFSFQHRDSQTRQTFGFIDPTSGYGLSSSLTYGRTFSRTLINSLAWSFSRNITHTLSSFSNGANIEGNLGIAGVATDPAFYGPPTINFTNFGALTDATPSIARAQTSGVTDSLINIRGKQTITFGVGFQRRQSNILSDSNGRGTFNFTGLATGYDLADFLLSRPQATSVATYADPSRYLRETTVNAYLSDDWRIKSNLTVNAGLRWEYFGPYTEKHGHMANLDFAPGFSAVAVVAPEQTGPYSGTYPAGLIIPDYKLFSPRIGVAWKPWKSRQLVARAGYGIYYNGSVYSQFGTRLIAQPPFANTSNLQTSIDAPLSLQNGFPPVISETIANTFAVDKNYTPGYAQSWNASLQQSIGRSWVFEVLYNGTKGTNLDVLRIPNRAPFGSPLTAQNNRLIPYASAFTFDSSVGNSIYHSGQIRFNRRFARGASFQILYTLSKSIDDTSTLGSGPVQDDRNIALERALSAFDQRHNLRVNYNYQSPINGTRTGFTADLLRGWTVGGTLTATSGTPFTAVVTGDPSGTGFTGVSRAQATGLPVTGGSSFFNPAAFTLPVTGTFGNAGRDTIPGIANFSLTASFFRSFRLDDKRRLEFRIDSTNPINHVNITQINTTVGSINYGLPANAGGMRTLTATVRLRF